LDPPNRISPNGRTFECEKVTTGPNIYVNMFPVELYDPLGMIMVVLWGLTIGVSIGKTYVNDVAE
jgi:hypothetical protein